jgi:lysylphosphatidylglycerol synthetase-like protein (DUF2156 family)
MSENGKKEEKQRENKDLKPFLVGLGVLLLASIAIYNYDTQLSFTNGEEGSFLYRAFYAIAGALGAIANLLKKAIDEITSHLGTEFWSVLVVLIVFVVLAVYISKE